MKPTLISLAVTPVDSSPVCAAPGATSAVATSVATAMPMASARRTERPTGRP